MANQVAVCSCGREDSVLGYGPTPASIMFIGIAPGADEWRNSKLPLTGPSGSLLNKTLESVGLRRKDVYCTNLVCFWKDLPTREEINECMPRLRRELELVKPDIIVTLGKLACETLLDRKFKDARGAFIKQDGCTWLPTYHPAACLHRANTPTEKNLQIEAAYSFCRDIAKLAKPSGTWTNPDYSVVTTLDEAQRLLIAMAKLGQPIALDIETNYDKEWDKAHPFDNDIVCIGIGCSPTYAHVIVLPVDQWAELQWPEHATYVYHNGAFDTQEIARHTGMWLPVSEDTMLQSYVLDERNERGLHKLKHLAREFVGADFYEEDDHRIGLGEQEQVQLAKLYEYNAKDVVYTWRLHQHLSSQMDDLDQRVYRELLLPATDVLRRSQYRGIYVDEQIIADIGFTFGTEFFTLQNKLNKWANEVLGDPQFNPSSPRQVAKLLEMQGYPVPNTQKATLLNLLDEYPDIDFVPDLLRYRTLWKLIGGYMTDIKQQIKYDGRVHPHPFLIGTVTGRLTYTHPAMQTLPKPKTVKDLGVIRKIFAATNDDYILLEADYAQIEAWLGAYFSQDDVLLADLQSGDWHSSVATGMFGKTEADCVAYEWAHLRDAAKHINYGSMYGEEAQGLTRRPPIGIGCDLRTAQDYLRKWRAHYPDFVAYQNKQRNAAIAAPYIQTPFGRKRRFPVIVNDHQLRQAVNCEIQSTASDYTLSSAIRLYELLEPLDTHLLFIEHDALYYEVARKHFHDAVALIRYEMERPPLPGLPSIKTEIDIGPNLAELEKLEVTV